MDRQIHKRLTLQVLLDRTAPEHGESSQNKQEGKSNNSTQETTSILELMVDWVQNKHRCKEPPSTLRYQWKGKEKEKKKKTEILSLSQSSKLGKITTLLGQDFSPEVHFQGNADPQEKRIYCYIKTSKEFNRQSKEVQSDASGYFHDCVKTMPHMLSELLCALKRENIRNNKLLTYGDGSVKPLKD